MALDFHEIRFPLDISLGSRGGPRRRTDIVTLASGREQRNARWAHSLRRYDAGLGVRTLDALAAVIAFFEERRGRLYGFRFRDRADALSCAPSPLYRRRRGERGVGRQDRPGRGAAGRRLALLSAASRLSPSSSTSCSFITSTAPPGRRASSP